MVCAAWPRMVDGMGDEESPEIEFGNVSHEILSDMLMGNDAVYSSSKVEEMECAKQAYDYAHKVWEEQGYENTTLRSEAYVSIKSTGRSDLWGSADIVIYNDNFLEIIDHKTGAGTFVNERTSAQLKLYALAAMEEFNLTPEVVHLTIVQPRYWGVDEKIRSIAVSPDGLRDWLRMAVTPAAERTDNPDAIGTATANCKKCAGRHVCEYRDSAIAEALTGQSEPGIPEALQTTMGVTEVAIRANQDLTVYDNDRLSQVLLLVPVIRDYCDALEEHAKEIIMKGEGVADFKVVATSGIPAWVGDMEELHTKLEGSLLKHEDYMKSKLRTPKQVAALKTGPKKDKPMSKAIAKVIADHTGRTPGGLSLVLESDPRDSVIPDFAAIDPDKVYTLSQSENPAGAVIEGAITSDKPALPAFLL